MLARNRRKSCKSRSNEERKEIGSSHESSRTSRSVSLSKTSAIGTDCVLSTNGAETVTQVETGSLSDIRQLSLSGCGEGHAGAGLLGGVIMVFTTRSMIWSAQSDG